MKRRPQDPGSMDMLLDTMCNTFGGVSFIALMVAIISAVIPKAEGDECSAAAAEAEFAAKEAESLLKRRDRLQEAVAIHARLAEQADAKAAVRKDLARMSAEIAANEARIRELEKKREEYLDELAKLKTKNRYSRKEAMRLERILKDLNRRIEQPLSGRHRKVRTPQEREITGLKEENVWIHRRRLYRFVDRDVKEEVLDPVGGKKRWRFSLNKGGGVPLDENFFRRGNVWREMVRQFDGGMYVRIFVDRESFEDLCLLRDALIDRKVMYNWKIIDEDWIEFVEGYDGKVQ